MTKKRTRKKKRTTASAPPADSIQKLTGWPWPLRPYQQKVEDKFQAGIQRHLLIWHRRAGKDVFSMSKARQECQKRIGAYVHFFPKHIQARRALWQGVDPKKGQRFIDVAFGDIEADRNNTEMFIEMMNGSTWQLLGSDNYDRVVGANIVGAVFSEWALCDPRAWDYIRPMILENNGWAIFITTYRGRNHAWQMVQQLKDNPEWYVDVRDIHGTTDIEGNPILTDKDMESERASGMPEAILQQEYFCNPEAVAEGSIYGKQVERLREDEPRHHAVWNPNKPVYAVWNFDLPIFASCVYVQPGAVPTILDARTWDFVTLGEAVAECYRQPFPIQKHLINAYQHDLVGPMADLDIYPDVNHRNGQFEVTSATASFLNSCHINKDKCELLLDALAGYVRRERFDAQTADLVFSENPADSWHMQLAQALETWAAWDYYSQGNTWSEAPDYSTQDKIARTIL